MATTELPRHTIGISSTGNVGKGLVEEACRRARYLNATIVAPEDDDSEATFVVRTNKVTVSAEEVALNRLTEAGHRLPRAASGWAIGLQHEFGIEDKTVWARACLQVRRRPVDDEPTLHVCRIDFPQDASVSGAVVLERLRGPVVKLLADLFLTSMGSDEFAASRDQVIDLCGDETTLVHEVVIDGNGKEPNLRVQLPMHRRGERELAIEIPLAGNWRAMSALGRRLRHELPAGTELLVGCHGQEALLQVLGEATGLPTLVLELRPASRASFLSADDRTFMGGQGQHLVFMTGAQQRRIEGRAVAVIASILSPDEPVPSVAFGLCRRSKAAKVALAALFVRGKPERFKEHPPVFLAEVPEPA